MWIFQRQHVGQRDQRPHSLELFQSRYLRVICFRTSLEPFVVLPNPFADRLYPLPSTVPVPFSIPDLDPGAPSPASSPVDCIRGTVPRKTLSDPRRIDQRRPCLNQARPRPDRHKIRLCLRTAMFHRANSSGSILTSRASIRDRTDRPFPTLSDQAHIARMRHDHFVPQFTQDPTYPGRVRPRF